MQPSSRKLEGIVPKEYKKTFSLYQEEEPTKFNLSSSPNPGGNMGGTPAPANPNDTSTDMGLQQPAAQEGTDTPPAEDDKTKDQSSWVVKKLVGLLRYAGAMAVELRGAVPDEANEIVEGLQEQLEKIAASLDPFVTNKEAQEGEEENTEEPVQEPEQTEQPTEPEQPTQEKPVNPQQPKFQRKTR